MDVSTILNNYTFFDFTKFRNQIIHHFKENAHLIDLTPDKIVSYRNELTSDGLLVDVYLADGERLNVENHDDVAEVDFCIEVILLGENNTTNAERYNELTSRTLRLAFIVEKLGTALNRTEFDGNFHLGEVLGFRAVFDPTESNNMVHNACAVLGSFTAYRRNDF